MLGDIHICGVLTDEATKSYRDKPIANFEERKAIISTLRCVDIVIPQNKLDSTENLKKIKSQFSGAQLILVHGDNWKKIPGEDYVKEIKGKIIKIPYYNRIPEKRIGIKR
jgi:glycerol-3-phosphate cytidylyltransferase-like family protein